MVVSGTYIKRQSGLPARTAGGCEPLSALRTGVSGSAEELMALRPFLRKALLVKPSHTCREVIERFAAAAERQEDDACAVVCDTGGVPVGLVMKSRLSLLQTHRFGREIYYGRSIVKLMDHTPLVVELSTPAMEVIDRAMSRDEATLYDCVIVMEAGCTAGILTMADLLQMSRMLQEQTVQSQIRTMQGTDELMRQIDTAVLHVHKAAQLGEQSTMTMVDLTHRGKDGLEKVTGAFKRLEEMTLLQEQQIAVLQKRAEAISKVSKLIRELAEQSNLLAVNASIEAARAGKHGSGFSVVAGEIRKLSAQTKRSADEINQLLASITEAVGQTVQLVAAGQKEAAASAAYVNEAAAAFGKLFHAAEGTKESALQIELFAKQAFQQSEQVLADIQQLMESMRAGNGGG